MPTKTKNATPGLVYDINLSGIYRPEKAVDLLGLTLRYRPLNIISQGYVYAFLVEVVKERIASPEELAKLKSTEVYDQVMEYLKIMANPEEAEASQSALSQMLLNPRGNKYMLSAIGLCFPDITEPENLTDEAFIQIIGFIFGQLQISGEESMNTG